MLNFQQIPPITKNLIIINVLVFVAQMSIPGLTEKFALHIYKSPGFEPYQLITHMFMHGSVTHIFFNMFGLYMFGSAIEYRLKEKRFLLYYLLTGFGAVLLHFAAMQFENSDIVDHLESMFALGQITQDQLYNGYMNTFNVTVGASGAIFGLLAAFAMLFPNQPIFLMFIPVPIKAKYFVLLYAGYELYQGIQLSGDNIAHFAHLGGALFGYLILREWKKKFYI